MAPKVEFTSLQGLTPEWLGTKLIDPKVTIPGGGTLDTTGLTPQSDGRLFIPSGTVWGRTDADAIAAAPWKLAADTHTIFTLNLHDIWDARNNENTLIDLLQPNAGNIVYWTYLPGWVSASPIGITLSAVVKAGLAKNFYVTKARP